MFKLSNYINPRSDLAVVENKLFLLLKSIEKNILKERTTSKKEIDFLRQKINFLENKIKGE